MKVRSFIAAATLVVSAMIPTGRAEVSVDVVENSINTLILQTIIEDADPLGVAWQPFRAIPIERVLNPAGHARGDGRPELVYERITSGGPIIDRPVVTWAWNTGIDHDIAMAEWEGTAWSAVEFLTAAAPDELDPRVFIDTDGTRHVVWWIAEPLETVQLVTRLAGTSVWPSPVSVVAGGRRPAVAMFEGTLRVVYERASTVPGMAQDVVVLRREAGGGFVEEFVTSSPRTERLDAMLHAQGGRMWIDWKHGSQVFGCAELASGVWGAVDEPAWTDPSWIGVESVRKTIAAEMTAP